MTVVSGNVRIVFAIFVSAVFLIAGSKDSKQSERGLGSSERNKYSSFPIDVRSIMRETDLEDTRCFSAVYGSDTIACNKRDTLLERLKKKNWCCGSVSYTYTDDILI